ncbi:MAG: efflux RND transporter periplasmic adaptor subunit, partial [Candidatus Krumholzibacteria bacterium]|nr:efflux RND transporter periplasmic adaptor subunit [Candidatus Krumholzibacteria bacterium]
MKGKTIFTVIAIVAVAFAGAAVVYRVLGPSKDQHAAVEEHQGEEEGHDEHGEEAVVQLTTAEMKEFGIEVGLAEGGTLHIYTTLPGEIVANQDHVAHVVPRFPGIVTDVRKQLGDHVEKGEVLAIIESNESLVEYQMKALIDGIVVEKHITLGEVLGEDDEAFVVADLSTVWVNLSVYQEDLPDVRTGLTAVISAGHDIPDVTAKISYVGPVVDEHTRTGLARAVLSNEKGLWRPGLFVTARILVSEETVPLLVPETALQTIE